MKALGLTIAFLALVVFLLPDLTAQEKKADDAKAEKKEDKKDEKKDPEKKDPDKKDPDKKDEKKDPEKKEPEKKAAKKDEDKVVYGQVILTKIVSMRPEVAHEFSVEMKQVDPERVLKFQLWQAQQMQSLANNPQGILQFQLQMQQQAAGVYTNKIVDVRAVDGVKVRSLLPPAAFDDQGNIKKWTQKELIKLKGNSKLKGYPSDMDALKVGQIVELYLAKTTPVKVAAKETKKEPPAKKAKFNDDDDPVAMPKNQPEVVMIVIVAEPMQQP